MMNQEKNPRTPGPAQPQRKGPLGHMPRTAAAVSVTAAAALALSACGSDDQLNGEDASEDVTVSPEESENPDGQADDQDGADAQDGQNQDDQDAEAEQGQQDSSGEEDQTLYDAIAAVLEDHPDAVFTEFDDEGSSYEFHLYDGERERELELDAESFDVIAEEEDGIDGDDQQEAEAVEIEFEDALRTAADEGGAPAADAELDTRDGTVVYEIELTDGTEVYVDVATGDVTDTGV